MWDGQIKVITGIRRVGKSTLLFDLFYDHLLKNGTSQNNVITLQLQRLLEATLLLELDLKEQQTAADSQHLKLQRLTHSHGAFLLCSTFHSNSICNLHLA